MTTSTCPPVYGATNPSPEEQASQPIKRFGSVIELNPEKEQYYRELHANTWPTVLDRIRKSNMRNFSIYITELNEKKYLFSYFEYIGTNFDADMAMVDSNPATIAWMKFTDKACQLPLTTRADGEWWARMRAILNPQEQY